jgi:striatin 1/3/4
MLTVRTHFDSVLAVAMISSENSPTPVAGSAGSFASAGRDGSICLSKLPVIESEKSSDPFTYEDYQGLKSHTIKRAHEDAVWHLHAHPLSNVLFSSGADGVVRTWAVSSGTRSLFVCSSHSKYTG